MRIIDDRPMSVKTSVETTASAPLSLTSPDPDRSAIIGRASCAPESDLQF
jgi:hypothetical protein